MVTLHRVTITDDTGARYTDLFADIPLEDYEILHGHAGITGVDAAIPAVPAGPRGNSESPLAELILRWSQAQIDQPDQIVGWQYLDAPDIHTIAVANPSGSAGAGAGEMTFITITGHKHAGRRFYRLRELTDALGLLVEPEYR